MPYQPIEDGLHVIARGVLIGNDSACPLVQVTNSGWAVRSGGRWPLKFREPPRPERIP
jgi:hypothetical protein